MRGRQRWARVLYPRPRSKVLCEGEGSAVCSQTLLARFSWSLGERERLMLKAEQRGFDLNHVAWAERQRRTLTGELDQCRLVHSDHVVRPGWEVMNDVRFTGDPSQCFGSSVYSLR